MLDSFPLLFAESLALRARCRRPFAGLSRAGVAVRLAAWAAVAIVSIALLVAARNLATLAIAHGRATLAVAIAYGLLRGARARAAADARRTGSWQVALPASPREWRILEAGRLVAIVALHALALSVLVAVAGMDAPSSQWVAAFAIATAIAYALPRRRERTPRERGARRVASTLPSTSSFRALGAWPLRAARGRLAAIARAQAIVFLLLPPNTPLGALLGSVAIWTVLVVVVELLRALGTAIAPMLAWLETTPASRRRAFAALVARTLVAVGLGCAAIAALVAAMRA